VLGGGVDIKVTSHLAIRPIEFDYFLTRFINNLTSGNNNQNNFRYRVLSWARSDARLQQSERQTATDNYNESVAPSEAVEAPSGTNCGSAPCLKAAYARLQGWSLIKGRL
jgi:hypothetical protein